MLRALRGKARTKSVIFQVTPFFVEYCTKNQYSPVMSDLSINLNVTAGAAAEEPVAGIYTRISLDELLIPHPAKTLLIRCPDDSRTDQGLYKGDLLVIDQSQPPRVGQWVIKVTNDEVSIHQIVNQSVHTSHSDSEILGTITYRIGKLP